jgi:uncharacterized protein (DUF433 family)
MAANERMRAAHRTIGYPSEIGARLGTMIDWSTCPGVERTPERVGGAWVFRGTRVPISALFENLEGGADITQFTEWFPGVTEQQARAVLDHAAKSALPAT